MAAGEIHHPAAPQAHYDHPVHYEYRQHIPIRYRYLLARSEGAGRTPKRNGDRRYLCVPCNDADQRYW